MDDIWDGPLIVPSAENAGLSFLSGPAFLALPTTPDLLRMIW
jgi:hypothetical protein